MATVSSIVASSVLATVLFAVTAPLARAQGDAAVATETAALPSSLVPVPRSDEGAKKREAELLRRARETEPAKVVFVGDSITQGWEGAGSGAWQHHLAPLGSLNLGNSGDRTEHVLWRLQQAPLTRLQPEHIVLLIGTNNLGHKTSTAAETLAGVEAVVKLLREQCPTAVVHILEIFPRSQHFDAMRGDICQINQALRAFVRTANAAAGEAAKLRIHDLGDRFVSADGSIDKAIMPDFLHLSRDGYSIWAEAMVAILAK